MSATFEDRCARIRYEAVMIRSEASHETVIAGHAGIISMGEIDLESAERSLATALETVRNLRTECEEMRHAIAA